MTPRQIALVRETFASVAPAADTVAALFYGKLFALDPALRPMFKGDIGEQGKKLMQALSFTIAGLEEPNKIVPVLHDLGRKHRGYGVESGHYDTVGAALIATLEEGLAASFTPDVREAWGAAYGLVAATMQAGAAQRAA